MVRADRNEGVAVDLGGWEVNDEFVGDYLWAVGDGLPTYFQHRLIPPVAMVARALAYLLERLELPPGAIHSLQEIETIKPVPFGEEITGTGYVSPSGHRGEMEFITARLTLKNSEGQPILESKSTVLVVDRSSVDSSLRGGPVDEGSKPLHPKSDKKIEGDGQAGVKLLQSVSKTITQEQLDAYARVSGDRNPLHLDAEFAANTMFGDIIAHGMLTLAFISEMMALTFERDWLETGGLRVRFKGAAYLGDRVGTQGRVTKEEPVPNGQKVTCNVAANNLDHGQELISGTATVVLDNA